MTFADFAFIATQIAEVLGYIALVFTPGLLVAAAFHFAKRAVARRAWAATCRTVAADYRQEQPLLDAAADIVNTYADRITPLYGKGE
ncbi:hypothetical protein G3I39_24830 [Streptomyces fulvissimus]|uniref:Uncharacterized protein n=1 Tax=Streptomyces microflavus TaxID=1919 RepID=A0A6N9VC12_STRMI|nr:hypothetical protein [Streptomyces microflavus]NEB70253.1 hypothetical protein [Streptomyces microflavus]NEE52287.1 hypothetical protein [Streptomyces sp. SID8455]